MLERFEWLDGEVRALLAREGVVRQHRAGAVLWTAGGGSRGLHLVLEGQVKIVRGGGNKQHVVHRASAGDTIGEIPAFDGGPYPATAIAVSDTTCLVVSGALLRRSMRLDPGVGWHFLTGLSARVRELVDRLDRRSAVSVRGRTARLIRERRDGSRDGWFRLGSSQAAVAEELGTVREVVVRTLRELRELGLVESDGRGRYRVLDSDRLDALALEATGVEDPA